MEKPKRICDLERLVEKLKSSVSPFVGHATHGIAYVGRDPICDEEETIINKSIDEAWGEANREYHWAKQDLIKKWLLEIDEFYHPENEHGLALMRETFDSIKDDFVLYAWKVTDTVKIVRKESDKSFRIMVGRDVCLFYGEADEVRRVALAIRGDE